MLRENDRVVTLVDKGRFPMGSHGVVLQLNPRRFNGEIGILDDQNVLQNIVTYNFSEILKIAE